MAETVPNRMYTFGATSWGAIDYFGPFPQQYTLIWDRLTAAGISWKYYLTDKNNFLAQFPGGLSRYGSHIVDISEYFNDLKNESTFPQVAFIERHVGLDEHPHNDVQLGAAHMKTLIDAFMQSPTFASSVFILAFDEGGGMYDHVPPFAVPAPDSIPPNLGPGDPPGDFTLSGFRVPVIIVSPWVKPHFVSHVNRDHTAILKFIETRFNLKPLTARDAAADDLMEFFDFNSPPNTKVPQLPDQPTNEPCDFTLELPG
jgi:phospholipase C